MIALFFGVLLVAAGYGLGVALMERRPFAAFFASVGLTAAGLWVVNQGVVL